MEESQLAKAFDPALIRSGHPVRRFRAVVALGTLMVALVGCSGDDTYLPALMADPMASYQAAGLELSDSWEHAQRESFLGSGPRQAQVGRTYRIEDQDNAEQLLQEAAALAEEEGWVLSQPNTNNPDFYEGTKELVPGTGELSLWLGADDPINDPSGPRQLKILIEYDPIPTD